MRSPFLLAFVLFAFVSAAYGQGEIPVDMYTGTPSISIPIGTISSLDVAQPVGLSYNANASQPSWFGQGWNLQAGGSITREVRGLPDDFGTADPQSPARKGWLSTFGSNTVAYDVLVFNPGLDTAGTSYGTSTPSLTGEAKNYDKLANIYKDEVDTEPDVFSYNVAGISGKFVFNNSASFTGDLSQTISTIPYRDIKIEPTLGTTSKKIESFKITTNDGYTYTFGLVCTASKKIIKDGAWTDVHILTTDYKLYANVVAYNVEWMLTEMKSPAGNTLTYTYTTDNLQPTPDEQVAVAMFREDDAFVAGSLEYMNRNIYKVQVSRNRKIPLAITGSTGSKLEFNYNTTDQVLESITLSDSRKGSSPSTSFVKKYSFSYIPVWYKQVSEAYTGYLYHRMYLRTFSEESGCSKTLPYTLSYNISNTNENLTGVWSVVAAMITEQDWHNNVVNSNETNYPQLFVYPSEPMKNRFRDQNIAGYGGTYYYLAGVDKGAYASKAGCLFSIQYPAGGMTAFFFEPNRYYDDKGNNTRFAEGLRVRKIDYWDGSGSAPISKTFDYVDASGKSSGKIFRRAIYNIPAYKWKDLYLPTLTTSNVYKSYGSIAAADRWKYLTIRTEWNIAPNDADNIVGYSRVKVSRTGSGYAIHEFEVPATHGQVTSGEWETPTTLFARKWQAGSPNSPMSVMTNTIFPTGGTWRFPNAPNPFYDYARGLPSRVSEYTEAGRRVRVVSTTYQNLYKTGSAANKVFGLKYDRFAFSEDNTSGDRIYLFSKYFLLTNADKVPLRDTIKLYDANDVTGTKFVTEITEYTYGSANHKLLTEIKKTSPDGNIYKTKFKYPKDYANQSTGEAAVQMLNTLATTFRHGAPIETVTTLKKGAGAELVTGATVIKYEPFDQSKPMPQSQWALELDAPVSDFVDSFIWSSSGYKFKIDSRYQQLSAVMGYKATGMPTKTMSAIGRDSAETGYGYTNTLPVIKSVKATSSQSVFSDFDNTTDFGFSYNGTPYFSTGRSGNAFYPAIALYKNNISRVMSANNYVLSFWLKSTATLDFNVHVKQATGSSTYLSMTPVTVNSTAGVFKYVEILVPMTTIASSIKLFRIEFLASGLTAIPPGGFTSPVIDDVFFFPEGTHMESYTYQIPYGVASVTTGTGASSSIEYDGLGRERVVRDRDGNIVKRNTHIIVGSPSPLFADFSTPIPVSADISATFRAIEPACAGTVSYEWDMDGAGYVAGLKNNVYTFDSPGMKTVKLRVSAAGYPTVEKVLTIEVHPVPITAALCAEGVEVFNATAATITSSFPDCPEISPAPTSWKTAFKLVSVTGCEGGCAYRWLRRDIGATTWLTVGSGGTQYTSEKITTNTNSFQVMCEITRGTEASFTTGPITITATRP